MSLTGKSVIVTGAGQGLGRAIAMVMAERGASVVLTGRTLSTLESAHTAILAADGRAEISVGDVGSRDDVARMVDLTVERFGGIDVLINNAMSLTRGGESVMSITDESLDIPMRSGLHGSLYAMQACYPHLKASGNGSIVNFGSSTSIRGEPGFGSYVIAKEAIRGLTRIAAREWGPDNIRVNVICPSGLTEGTKVYADAGSRRICSKVAAGAAEKSW